MAQLQSTVVTGNTSTTGFMSAGSRRLSMGILDLNSSGTPTQFKIKTTIPWNSGGADFTVNIKGFRYSNGQMVSLSVGWHHYLNTFYNEGAISNGGWAPPLTLAKSPDNFVIIHIASPGYWPKLYVESLYSSTYLDAYSSGWTWSDADLSDCTDVSLVPYNLLATSISGNAATTSQTNFATLTLNSAAVATQTWVQSQGYLTSVSDVWVNTTGDTMTGTLTIARGQDANVTNLNINSGVTPVSAFQINSDQPNLRSILMARNGYSLVLGTQDTNRVTIDTSGNVGIGTASPTLRVQIDTTGFSLRLRETSDGSSLVMSGNQIQARTSADAGSPLYLNYTNGGNIYTGSGLVGIGTINPGAKLEVYNGDIWLNAASAGINPEIRFIDDSGISVAGAKIRYGNADGNLYIEHIWDTTTSGIFFRNRTGGTALNTLSLVNGNVGIQATAPIAKLQIGSSWTANPGAVNTIYLGVSGFAGSNLAPEVIITSNIASTAPGGAIGLALHNSNTTAGAFAPLLVFSKTETGDTPYNASLAAIGARTVTGSGSGNAYIDGELIFYTAPTVGTGLLERMRITESGQVLMGTTTTQSGARLQVAGGFLDVWSSANTLLRLRHDGTRGIIETFTSGAYSNTAINPDGGNVGIGTSGPSGKFEVAGGTGSTGVQSYFSTGAGFTAPVAGNASHPGGAKIILWNDTSTPQKASIGMDANADIWFNNAGAQNGAGFTFYTGDGAATAPMQRLKITKAGLIGIGTIIPQAQLQVGSNLGSGLNVYSFAGYKFGVENGTSRFIGPEVTGSSQSIVIADFLLGASAAWGAPTGLLTFTGRDRGNNVDSGVLGYIGIAKTTAANAVGSGDLVFGTAAAASLTSAERMRITNTGNVGIGATANINQRLVVQGTISAASTNGYTLNGVINGNQVLTGESSPRGIAGLTAVGTVASFAIKTDPLGRAFGTVGLVGAAYDASGGGRNVFGVYGYALQEPAAANNGENKPVAGLFISELGSSAGSGGAYNGTMYGVYASANSSGATNSAGSIIGVYGVATGRSGDTTYGGYFAASGGTTNYGLIVSSGNVGIGNTSPTIYGGYTVVHIGSASSVGLIKLGTGASVNGPEIFTNSTNNLYFNSDNTNTRVTILGTNGNVGIGTASPTDPLHIAIPGADKFIKIENSTHYTGLWMNDSGTNNGWLVMSGFTTASSPGDFAIREYGVQTSLTIKQTTGNVGIGTASPTSKLFVQGDGIIINNTTGQASYASGIKFRNDGYEHWTAGVKNSAFVIAGTGSNGDNIWAGASTADRFVITAAGNVGINATGATYRLEVVADAAGLFVSGAGVSPYNQKIATFRYAGNGNDINIENSGGKAAIQARVGAAVMELILNGAGGNVGVGTAAPNSSLHVSRGGVTFQVTDTNKTANNTLSIYGFSQTAFAIATGTAGTFSGGEKIVIADSGNIGIGITAPTNKLHIKISDATHANEGIYFESPSGYGGAGIYHDYNQGNGQTAFKIHNTYSGAMVTLSQEGYNAAGSPGSIRFYTSPSAGANTPIERGRITPGGTFVFGDTVIPGETVWKGTAVFGQNGTNKVITGYLTSSTNGAIIGGHSSALNAWADLNIAGINLIFRSSETEFMRLTSIGRLGIGVTTPQKKLDVVGTGIVASFGGLIGVGNIAGISFGYSESTYDNDAYKKAALVFERTESHGQGANASGKIHFLLNNVGGTSATALTDAVVTIDSGSTGAVGSVRMGIGTRNPTMTLDVVGSIRASEMYGTTYDTLTSGAGTGTAVYDTLTTSGAGAYEVVIKANPNGGGSGSYRDWYIGKLVIGTGYDGAAVVHYIDFIQQTPQPRTLFGSGGGNLTVTAIFNNSGTESESAADGATYIIRFKISGYNTAYTGAGTAIYLKKIGI